MGPRNRRFVALALGVCLLSLVAQVTTEQGPVQTRQPADGLLRSELSLAGHTVAVAFAPALKADDPAHRGVLSGAGGSANARVRVGQLVTTNGTLRLGTFDLPKADQAGLRYGLWLEGTSNGWQLQVTGVSASEREAAAPPSMVGQVALSRQASAVASPTFAAALVPTAGDAGQLVLRWGGYEGATDLKFVDPPVQQRRANAENGLPNVGVQRGNFDDTSAISRARFLGQNNETAIVLPDGKRLSASFVRSSSGPPPPSGREAPVFAGRGLNVGGADFPHIASAADGAVVELTESAVPRLKIEMPLRFGKVMVRTGNQVGGFPGAYGIWLKRVGSGWRLVLNDESDAWGSQHDPKFDAAEIDLAHSEGDAASRRPFGVALVPTAADRGRFLIIWGPHEWTTDFVVAR